VTEQPSFVVVAIPISAYAHHVSVPEIDDDAAGIVRLLEEFGGAELPWTVTPERRGTQAVTGRLAAWANHDTPRNSILIWLGHGEAVAGDAWLATQETVWPIRYQGFRPDNLGDAITREWHQRDNGTDQWTIVVIEACGSGTFAQMLVKALPTDHTPQRLAIIPVSGPGASYLGQFRRALATAIRSYTVNDRLVDVDELVRRIANQLPASSVITIGLHGLPPIRRTLDDTTATLPLDTYAMLKAAVGVLPTSSARGGELRELAWHFVGREADRIRILEWLAGTFGGMFVVTGPAGSGKSALLANVLVQTDPGLRDVFGRVDGQLLLPATGSPAGPVFDLVIHLTGLTTNDVVRRIAGAAAIDDPLPDFGPVQNVDWLVDNLVGRRLTILADALDEAQEAYAIASVLRRVTSMPGVRVVVGTRTDRTRVG
jgi:hypothetical protein